MSANLATLHPLRVAGRAIAAGLFHAARAAAVKRGCGAATSRAIAERWGLKAHRSIDYLGDPTSGHALALGDLLAMPVDLARDVLIGALAHIDAAADVSARDTIDSLAIDLGEALADLRRDLRDGREDDHADHAAAFRRLSALALRGAAAAERRAAGERR